jgi:transposase-like protein
MAADPWVFGWTPLLTLIGFAITLGLGVAGFNTFGKWKRQLIEERRLETAIEALSLAYESKYVFDIIRSPMSFEYEWDDMPKTQGETEKERRRKGSFYAVARRIRLNKDFFERAFKLQPRCMAMFGKEAEDIFMLMHQARRAIEVSSQMLAWKVSQYEDHEPPDHNAAFYEQC